VWSQAQVGNDAGKHIYIKGLKKLGAESMERKRDRSKEISQR